MTDQQIPEGQALLFERVTKTFGRGIGATTVLDQVSFSVPVGVCLGLVGESGSGKSTIAKIASGLYGFDAGRLVIGNKEFWPRRRYPAAARRSMSYIPQNPFSSFDPRRSVGQSLVEAISPRARTIGKYRDQLVQWLERVGLPADSLDRYPHQFSGGQRQRIAIARGMIRNPSLIIADEVTSALDMSVQAQVLDLLDDLRRERGFAMLFISHNLAVVQRVCDRVMVMQGGAIVEDGTTRDVLSRPTSSYTRRLLESVPGAPTFSLETSV